MFFQDNRRAKAVFTFTMLIAFEGVVTYLKPEYAQLYSYLITAVTLYIMWEISQL